jgi:hypothetical protein
MLKSFYLVASLAIPIVFLSNDVKLKDTINQGVNLAQNNNPEETNFCKKDDIYCEKIEGFSFKFRGCERQSADVMVCNFLVENSKGRRRLRLLDDDTRIIDSAGDELRATSMSLASKEGGNIHNELPTDIPIKGTAVFEGSIGTDIRLFEIDAHRFTVEFIPN